MNVSLVPVHMVDTVWPHVVAGFQRASTRSGGDLTVADLWIGCRAGHCFLFVVQNAENQIIAATAWKPEAWGKGQRFRCLGLYGKGVREWADTLRDHVSQVAKLCRCNGLIADGRDGWKVIFPDAKRLRAVYEVAI